MTVRRLPALHPLAAALLALITAQCAGLVAHYFGTDATGQRIYSSPLNMLMLAVPLYLSCLLALARALLGALGSCSASGFGPR